MVASQHIPSNPRLLGGIIRGLEDVLHKPFVAGGGGEHTAHQVIPPVGMGKGVESMVGVHPEMVRRDEDGAGGAQGDVAAALPYRSGAHGSGGIVSSSGSHPNRLRQAQFLGHLWQEGPHSLVALIQAGHLAFLQSTQGQHFRRPALA